MIMPPHWYPFQPYMALPALQAHLKKQGFSVASLNLNILTLDHFLSGKRLATYLEKAEQRTFGPQPDGAGRNERREKYFRRISMVAPRLLEQVDQAVNVLRGPGYYEYLLRAESLKVLVQAMDVVTACYFPSQYTLNGFVTRQNQSNPDQLNQILASREANPFLEYFEATLKAELCRLEPKVVGINITGDSQLVGGLSAARLVKLLAPQAHVVVGGSFFSRLLEQLPRFPQVFEQVDSIIAYEGEISLAELVDRVIQGKELSKVPHRCWRDASGQVRFNGDLVQPDVNSLATPDYEGAEMHLHLTPHPVPAVAASRGCYWNRCLFCDHGFCYQNRYQERSPELVVDDMAQISAKWGAKYFDIIDEALHPRHMSNISAEIMRRELDVRWMCLGRIDKSFSPEIFKAAHQAGCRLISYGVESNHNDVLRKMIKGTNKELNLRILGESTQAGIWTHIMIFFGFPGETPEGVRATMDLLDKYDSVFNDSGGAAFVLCRHSRVLEDLAKHGIKDDEAWRTSPDLAYSLSVPFGFTSGQKTADAERAVEEFKQKSVRKKGSWDRTVSLLYRDRFSDDDFERFVKLFNEYGIRQRIADLSAMPGFEGK